MAQPFVLQPDPAITQKFIDQWKSADVFTLQANVAKVNANVLANKDEDLVIMDIGADKCFIAPAHVATGEVKQTGPAKIHFLKDGAILQKISTELSELLKIKKVARIACSGHGQIDGHVWVDHC